MTLKEIRSMMEIWSGNVVGGRGTPLLYNVFINEAQKKIASLDMILGRWAECPSVADQSHYKIWNKSLKLISVYVYNSDSSYWKPIDSVETTFKNKTEEDWLKLSSQTVPDAYSKNGDRLTMIPPFDAIVSPAIRIEYTRKPDTLVNDGDISLIDDMYHIYIAKLAFVSMFPNDPKANDFRGDLVEAKMEMLVQTMEDDMGRRTVTIPAS